MKSKSISVQSSGGDLLWDVFEEHLDEAQFACETFEAQLSDATLDLGQIEEDIEARLWAHVDGLVLGGAAVAQRVLIPALQPGELEPSRATAAAFALIHGEQPKLAAPALLSADDALRRATLRGIMLAGAEPLEAWAVDRLREPGEHAALLPIAAHRLPPAELLRCLQSPHAEVVAAAAQSVPKDAHSFFGPCMERLLEHDEPKVRRAALHAGLAWDSRDARSALERCALDDPDALALFAALCSRKQHARLVALLEQSERAQRGLRVSALFALGFSGSVELVPALLEQLDDPDRYLAKLAAQAIQVITGIDTQADEFTLPIPAPGDVAALPAVKDDPEALATLPDLDDDDLDADLVPAPEDAMPDPDAMAIRKHWGEIRSGFSPEQRYVLGKPISVGSLLDALEHARMRVRHVLALSLGIRTGGQCWLDTHLLIRTQRQQLATLRKLRLASFARQFTF